MDVSILLLSFMLTLLSLCGVCIPQRPQVEVVASSTADAFTYGAVKVLASASMKCEGNKRIIYVPRFKRRFMATAMLYEWPSNDQYVWWHLQVAYMAIEYQELACSACHVVWHELLLLCLCVATYITNSGISKPVVGHIMSFCLCAFVLCRDYAADCVLRAGKDTNPINLAKFIDKSLSQHGHAVLKTYGQAAACQAVKALAIAREKLLTKGYEIGVVPEYCVTKGAATGDEVGCSSKLRCIHLSTSHNCNKL